jgi:hypothetical protein
MRKTLTVAIAALAIGLTGCARTPDNANTQKYPQEAKDNFVSNCTSEAEKARPGSGQQARTACKCIVDKLEASLPYDVKQGDASFKDADMALKDGKPLPGTVQTKLDQATAACRK